MDVGELMRLWTGDADVGNRSKSSPELHLWETSSNVDWDDATSMNELILR